MKYAGVNIAKASGLIALGIAFAAGAIYRGEMDDAPGASLVGILVMIGAVVLGVSIALRTQ
jgi:hypothetical protein